jgi:Ras-related protein Rab-1A
MNTDFDHLSKIVIIGDSGVGKSCLLTQYADNEFTTEHQSTIGVDFKIRTIDALGKVIKCQIWDTAGQERFRSIVSSYYNGAHGIIIVYDVTNRDSFESIKSTWISDVREYTPEEIPIIIIGNKSDLKDDRVVKKDELREYATKHNYMYLETSAKKFKNVEDMFQNLVNKIVEKKVYMRQKPSYTVKNLYQDSNQNQSSWCYC